MKKPRTVRIKITTTQIVVEHLEALLPLGLYGKTVAEAAERLLCEALRGDLRSTRQGLIGAKFKPKK